MSNDLCSIVSLLSLKSEYYQTLCNILFQLWSLITSQLFFYDFDDYNLSYNRIILS